MTDTTTVRPLSPREQQRLELYRSSIRATVPDALRAEYLADVDRQESDLQTAPCPPCPPWCEFAPCAFEYTGTAGTRERDHQLTIGAHVCVTSEDLLVDGVQTNGTPYLLVNVERRKLSAEAAAALASEVLNGASKLRAFVAANR